MEFTCYGDGYNGLSSWNRLYWLEVDEFYIYGEENIFLPSDVRYVCVSGVRDGQLSLGKMTVDGGAAVRQLRKRHVFNLGVSTGNKTDTPI